MYKGHISHLTRSDLRTTPPVSGAENEKTRAHPKAFLSFPEVSVSPYTPPPREIKLTGSTFSAFSSHARATPRWTSPRHPLQDATRHTRIYLHAGDAYGKALSPCLSALATGPASCANADRHSIAIHTTPLCCPCFVSYW